jgi:hypothetical protein
MKMIEDVYDEYYIMPELRKHMYRVASVAGFICDSLDVNVDKKSVVTACLIHDMGNIIKFDLNKFPEFNEPKGIAYWEVVKKNYIDKYGTDVHQATLSIAFGLGMSLRVLELLNSIGFGKSPSVYESNDLEKMICIYSDMRVTPNGVTSLKDRLNDLESRYSNNPDIKRGKELQDIYLALYSIEQKIFDNTNLTPNEITNEQCEQSVLLLKKSFI